MGSGSSGGGGGGTGGATAGGGKGYGGYRISGGRIIVANVDATEKSKAVTKVLKRFRPEYLHEQFVGSSARDVYRELSRLRIDLAVNRDWAGIERRFGIDGGRGCLQRLAAALMSSLETADRDQKSHGFVRMALENSLLRLVGDDTKLYSSGTAGAVIGSLDPGVFDHLAGLFLGDLLYEVMRGEERALPPQVKQGLRGVVQQKVDRIIDNFETRFRGKPLGNIPQVSFPHLFDVIAAQEDWFVDQLRR